MLVDNCLVYVLYIFIVKFLFKNSIKSSEFPFSMNFTNPLRRFLPRCTQKIIKTFSKQPETWICEMSIEICYFLKRERDILMNSHHNTAFRCTPFWSHYGVATILFLCKSLLSLLSPLPPSPLSYLLLSRFSLKKKSTNTSGK